MTYGQLMALADVIDSRFRITVLLGGLAGLRFGEIAGLTAKSLVTKADGPWLTITQQLNRKGKLAPCKTNSSERSVAIGTLLDTELSQYVKLNPPSPIGTLVTAANGGPLSASNFRRDVWKPAQRRMRDLDPTWEHRTPHDLRHTYASLLILAGEHPKVIQEAMGHGSIRVTMDIYGHLMDGLGASARSAIDSLAPPTTLHLVTDSEAVA